MIDIYHDSPESLNIAETDNVVLLSNEDSKGEVALFGSIAKLLFKPESLKVGVLFENPNLARKVDNSIYKVDCQVNLPIEIKLDDLSYPEILPPLANIISDWMLGNDGEKPMDWSKVKEKFEKIGFQTQLIPSLSDYRFGKLIYNSLKEKYELKFKREMSDNVAKGFLPGVNEGIFIKPELYILQRSK